MAKKEGFFDEINRLRPSKLRLYRLKVLVEEQFECCGLCAQPVHPTESALDHDHKTGRIRSVLHLFCNSMLGKIENHLVRTKFPQDRLEVISPAIFKYINKDYSSNPYHPSYRTEEEKKARRNQKAKARRQKKKVENGITQG